MSLGLTEAIIIKIKNDPILKVYIEDKVFPIFAENDTPNPYISIRRKLIESTYSNDGHCYDDSKIDILITSDNYFDNIKIAQAVRNLFEFKVEKINDVMIFQCFLENIDETFGIDGYITTISFAIRSK
ncbi:MAG: hypothetical protein HXX18_15175 [Bacteroidetes bacterium]|nr:hypothetical protein [Bacteroidota bacterium]